MKKKEKIAFILDAICAATLSIGIAFTPILIKKEVRQILFYGLLALIYLIYLLFLKQFSVKWLIHLGDDSVENVVRHSLRKKTQEEIIPKLETMYTLSKIQTEWSKYYLFWNWYSSTSFVITFFWKDKITNVEYSKELVIDEEKVYDYELKIIIDELINVYSNNNGFKEICEKYKIQNLSQDIKNKKEVLDGISKLL